MTEMNLLSILRLAPVISNLSLLTNLHLLVTGLFPFLSVLEIDIEDFIVPRAKSSNFEI